MTTRRPAEARPAVTVLVVAKEPVPGRVKTRLTPPFTPAQAAAVAEAAIADTLTAVSGLARIPGLGAVRPVLVLDGAAGPWLRVPVEVVPQAAGPFDVRLAAAFDAVSGPALLIGMDTPQVTPALLADACRALGRADAVFGPAADGGWWALGLRRPDGGLLRGVATSRPDTGARQRDRLTRAGLRVATLPVLRDVDTCADADAVARLVPHGRFAAAVRGVTGGATAATQALVTR
ncbi:TIGR04282 family arsenosugar biosynthesis glycosyltransferase [Pseudofrankia inefficax]|uniref:Glycosyltransferase n=1 Tax=Pseudofrankia inefficax (strain DSM 45817 / CECT 9037 / DDB 130130 / EuI1c) TaxID=298654 RepID=E3J9D2_PSEI1|nr:DUF2064 domain-containing protein [Pseudofrankia inefficax]ADP82151.1 Protein of unknown function DUF2064 [Pseudofrankia inefficax]